MHKNVCLSYIIPFLVDYVKPSTLSHSSNVNFKLIEYHNGSNTQKGALGCKYIYNILLTMLHVKKQNTPSHKLMYQIKQLQPQQTIKR